MKPPALLTRLRSSRLAGDTFGYTFAIVLGRLPPFLFLPVFASALPPAALGHYLTAAILADLVQSLSTLGMVQALFRFFPKAEGQAERRAFMGTALCTGMAGAAATVTVFVSAYSIPAVRGTLEAFRNLPPAPFALALTAGVFIAITSILSASLWAQQRSRAYLIAFGGGAALEAALSGAMIASHAISLERMLAIECAKDAAVALAVAWVARKNLSLRFDRKRFRDLFRFGVWFVPMGICTWMLFSTDRFWLGQAASMADVGVYGFFYKFASPVSVLFQGYVMSMDSQLFKVRAEEAPVLVQAALRAFLRRAGGMLALAALAVPAAVWVAVRDRGLLPPVYLHGLRAYPLLLGSSYLYYWAAHHAALLDYRLRSRRQLEFMACAAIANFLFCPLAIALGRRVGVEPLIAVPYANLAGVGVLLALYVKEGEPAARAAWPAAVAPLLALAALHAAWGWAGL